MAADESNEGTGDPLRDAIIAQGKAEHAAREKPFIDPDEYADWLAPREALTELIGMDSLDTIARTINTHLSRDFIRAAAKVVVQTTAEDRRQNRHVLIMGSIWEDGPPDYDDSFWDNAQVEITSHTYDGTVVTEFFGVRFDPEGIAELKRDAGLVMKPSRAPSVPLKLPQHKSEDAPSAPKQAEKQKNDDALLVATKNPGGRPAGKDGEPIARVTLRLRKLSEGEMATYTQEALGSELIEEYRALGLHPPSLDNAKRNAGGILRALRNV